MCGSMCDPQTLWISPLYVSYNEVQLEGIHEEEHEPEKHAITDSMSFPDTCSLQGTL